MPLELFYITNNPEVAKIAEEYGVNRLWIDLEVLGKKEQQKGRNTVRSPLSISDIAKLKKVLKKSQLMVRVNPWNKSSDEEIAKVLDSGAEVLMLPMWKTFGEVEHFLKAVNGRAKTNLLLETKEAEAILPDVLSIKEIDEFHIGLNDLHLSYGLKFMFELLANGTVERICQKIKAAGFPYGFGGIARLGAGLLPAEKIIMEHYRLGSTRAILARSFCNYEEAASIAEVRTIFANEMAKLREFEKKAAAATPAEYAQNQKAVIEAVKIITGKADEWAR